jgi:FkbM family methyltransferase
MEQVNEHLAARAKEVRVRLDYAAANIGIVVESAVDIELRSRSCAKEPETVAFLERWCRSGERLYDIGANVGAYALIAAHLGAEVVAFEPVARNYLALVRNARMNRMPRIMPVCLALSNRTGVAWLTLDSDQSGASAHLFRPLDGRAEERTTVWKLDDLIRVLTLAPPSVLKCDVDGWEYEVLQGASETLKGVRAAIVETAEANLGYCADLMLAAGFHQSGYHPRIASGVFNVEWER